MRIEYTRVASKTYDQNDVKIDSFINEIDGNIDWKTVNSFGEEWEKFHNFDEKDLQTIGNDYFDIVPFENLPKDSLILDVGCGSGRWVKYLSSKVGFIEAIDPSKAAFIAAKELSELQNCRVTMASVDNIPFQNNSFDLVYSLGVLHHIPDTKDALKKCVNMAKIGGYILIYLYYNLDNRTGLYKSVFKISNLFRLLISKSPNVLKKWLCDIIAVVVYLPFIFISALLECLGATKLSEQIPLSYYKRTSFQIIRNDALDRFGTPLEQRFSKKEIETMMTEVGLSNIKFSNQPPYWHAIGQK